MKKNLDSFYLEYMGWIKTKNHLTLLSLARAQRVPFGPKKVHNTARRYINSYYVPPPLPANKPCPRKCWAVLGPGSDSFRYLEARGEAKTPSQT